MKKLVLQSSFSDDCKKIKKFLKKVLTKPDKDAIIQSESETKLNKRKRGKDYVDNDKSTGNGND